MALHFGTTLVLCIIITIVIINIIWNGNKTTNKQEDNPSSKQLATSTDGQIKQDTTQTTNLEEKLDSYCGNQKSCTECIFNCDCRNWEIGHEKEVEEDYEKYIEKEC